MKRILLTILILFTLSCGTAYAGGTCVIQEVGGNYVYQGQVLLLMTADSGDASMSCTFSAGDLFMNLMDGRYVLNGYTYDSAGVDPTADSDMQISDSDGMIFLSATGNGADVIDTADDHSFYFEGPDGANGYPRAASNKPWTITWSNNAVNSAVQYLRMDVTGKRNVE